MLLVVGVAGECARLHVRHQVYDAEEKLVGNVPGVFAALGHQVFSESAGGWAGAEAGAAVGACVGGPVGAVVGGAVGAAIGSGAGKAFAGWVNTKTHGLFH